jgi:hypothetical protein
MISAEKVEEFAMPPKFNWKESTSENYKNKSITDFIGAYVKERKKLDYTWHNNYTRERQAWQDKVIDSVVRKVSPQSNPWIVYTCGPMAAGKGYCLTWMSQNGYVSFLPSVAHISVKIQSLTQLFFAGTSRWRILCTSTPITLNQS